jgi:hypothetical protein
MRGNKLKSMSIDELWNLHEEVTLELTQKLRSEKIRLKQRLHQLRGADNASDLYRMRRPYPACSSEVSKSEELNGDLVRPWEATPVA